MHDDSLAEVVRAAAQRNEGLIAWMRLAAEIIAVANLILMIQGGAEESVGPLLYVLAALPASYRWGGRPWFKYVVTTLDGYLVVHATVIDPVKADPVAQFAMLGLAGSLLAGVASLRLSRAASTYANCVLAVMLAIGYWRFRTGWYMTLSVCVITTLAGILSYFVMRQMLRLYEQVVVRDRLTRFLPADLAERALEDPSLLQLGGRQQPATILFADIRGFTTLSEKHGPEEVIAFLNHYHRLTTAAIDQFGGTVDKFIGDGVMALFGAPLPHDDHADRAVRAAVEMVRRLAEFNRAGISPGFCPIRIGVGINTATVVVGNVGTERRMDYTAIGDGVNVAARLEGVTKETGTPILISAATYEQLSDKMGAQPVGDVPIRGRTQQLRAYSVPCPPAEPNEPKSARKQ